MNRINGVIIRDLERHRDELDDLMWESLQGEFWTNNSLRIVMWGCILNIKIESFVVVGLKEFYCK